jgi:hypothetical protein
MDSTHDPAMKSAITLLPALLICTNFTQGTTLKLTARSCYISTSTSKVSAYSGALQPKANNRAA